MTERAPIVVFCERIDNESFCESIVRELSAHYEVRPFGPGWPVSKLEDVNLSGARFYLELDSASGEFYRPEGLSHVSLPKFAWLIDTHKKPGFHQTVARDMDLTFFAMKNWGHVFHDRKAIWLPLHADTEIWKPAPAEAERDLDLVFVGSYDWRAEPLKRIASRHGLKLHVSCTTGRREKSETAALYARSRLVFNRHVTNDLNFRVFEATASGRVLLTDAQENGQYELFQDGRHYVLYKDERDLERLVLALLRDEPARLRIEREAALHAREHHSTRARVRQLRDAIEAFLGPKLEATVFPEVGTSRRVLDPTPTEEKRRWLVFAGSEPKTVERRSYAERLALGLSRRGHEVVVTRLSRRTLPATPSRPGEPVVFDLNPGPLPVHPTESNRALAVSSVLHARFDRIAREHGPFDVVVGEGGLGALVAQPFAERSELPFLLALERCEVDRRKNKLTREQLYWAELEHWGADRAAAILCADRDTKAAVEKFYKTERAHLVASASTVSPTGSPERLLAALGLGDAPLVLVVGEARGEAEKRALLLGNSPEAVVLATDDVWIRTASGEVRVSRVPAVGSVLAALMAEARAVVALDRADARVDEAAALGKPVAFADRPTTLDALLACADKARTVDPDHGEGVPILEEIAANNVPAETLRVL